jgi:hypothetical protein
MVKMLHEHFKKNADDRVYTIFWKKNKIEFELLNF